MDLPRALIVSSHPSRFVMQDVKILQEAFYAEYLSYRGKLDLPRLVARSLGSSVSLAWFVLGYATTLALLRQCTRRPLVLVAGGWDVRTVPEIGYGAAVTEARLQLTRFALRHADLVLAVSEDLARSAREIEDREVPVVHLGVDTQQFRPGGPRDGSIMTVSGATSEVDIRRKGLVGFLEMARRFPDRRFVLVGASGNESQRNLLGRLPSNLEVLGHVEDDVLLASYRRASIYYQVSAYESFGLSVAEAMSCGCTPVVSDRGGLPEVVGPAGYYAQFEDNDSTEEAFHRALAKPTGLEARHRVVESFDISRRRAALLGLVGKLAS